MPKRKYSTTAPNHGYSNTSEYTAWAHMVQRTTNPNCPSWSDYGGRGIGCDPSWLAFQNFIADMGMKPTSKHTLERKDNNKGYSPENCEWATNHKQQRNRRDNRWITWDGRTQVITDWSRELGGKSHSLTTRLARGWSLERAMTTPFTPFSVAEAGSRY